MAASAVTHRNGMIPENTRFSFHCYSDPDFLAMVLTGLFLAGGSTGIYKFLKRARKIKDAAAATRLAQGHH